MLILQISKARRKFRISSEKENPLSVLKVLKVMFATLCLLAEG